MAQAAVQQDIERINHLVPEDHFITSLSPLWQRRFDQALQIIAEQFNQPLSWPEVAGQCAISPNHFHQLFRSVTGITPGQYQRRMRLKYAVYQLCVHRLKSVTDIALESGFSSSQALAKALKRDLDITASEIREEDDSAEFGMLKQLAEKLSHPLADTDGSLEKQLADSLMFEIVELPYRPLKTETVAAEVFLQHLPGWVGKLPDSCDELLFVYHEQDMDRREQGLQYRMGFVADPSQANDGIKAQRYLSCRLAISSETGYFFAWQALYRHLLAEALEPDSEAEFVEVVHDIRNWRSRVMHTTLMLPLKPCGQ